MKKFLIFLVLLVLVGIGGAVWWGVSNLDDFAKGIIERAGSQATGTQVTVGSVEVKLTEGRATVRDLTLANPPGYSSNPAVSFEVVSIKVSTDEIQEIYSRGATIRMEQRGRVSNLDALQNRLARSAEKERREHPDRAAEKHEDKGQTYKIKRVKIEDSTLILTSDRMAQPSVLNITNINLQDLQGTPRQLAEQVLGQVLGQAMRAAAKKAAHRQVDKMLKKEDGAIKDLLKKLGK